MHVSLTLHYLFKNVRHKFKGKLKMRRRKKGKKSLEQQSQRTPFRFFKIILPFILDSKILRMPQTFTKKYGHQISGEATLTLPTGVAWKVGVTKEENKLYFEEGWAQFMEDNLVKYGYFLEFEYSENAHFKVHIFDLTCCEIDYPRRKGKEEDDGRRPPSPPHGVKKEVQEQVEATHTGGGNASFSVCVRPYNFIFLHIPKSMEKYTKEKATEQVKLQAEDGKEWLVEGHISKSGGLRLTGSEWMKFTRDNNWHLDDIYRFQIIETHQDPHSLLLQVLKA